MPLELPRKKEFFNEIDDGTTQKVVELNKPHIGVYIPALVWKEMYDFSDNSVLLVLASSHYEESEYINDYNEFLHIRNILK